MIILTKANQSEGPPNIRSGSTSAVRHLKAAEGHGSLSNLAREAGIRRPTTKNLAPHNGSMPKASGN